MFTYLPSADRPLQHTSDVSNVLRYIVTTDDMFRWRSHVVMGVRSSPT